MYKLVQLFQNDIITNLKNLARYIMQALKCRNSVINNNVAELYLIIYTMKYLISVPVHDRRSGLVFRFDKAERWSDEQVM